MTKIKTTIPSVGKEWSNRNSHILLGETSNGTNTLESNLSVSKRLNVPLPYIKYGNIPYSVYPVNTLDTSMFSNFKCVQEMCKNSHCIAAHDGEQMEINYSSSGTNTL